MASITRMQGQSFDFTAHTLASILHPPWQPLPLGQPRTVTLLSLSPSLIPRSFLDGSHNPRGELIYRLMSLEKPFYLSTSPIYM